MILKTQQSVVRKWESKVAKRLRKELKSLGEWIVKLVEQQEWERSIENDLQEYIEMRWLKTRQRISRDLSNLYMLGARYINKAVNWNVDLEKVNLMAVRRVNSLKSLAGTNIEWSINQTTFNRVREIISDGLFDGSSYKEIGNNIQSQIGAGVFSKERADLVAVNTVGNAYEQGRLASMEDLVRQGYLVEKIRDTVWDSRVTPECRRNEEQGRITFKENRPSWDNAAPRASNPRCRCTIDYQIL